MKNKLALTLPILLLSVAAAASAASSRTQQDETTQQTSTPGLANGVEESTDQDRINTIEEHARQLETKQLDKEPPAAGKRHKHSRKHGAKKPAPQNMDTNKDVNTETGVPDAGSTPPSR